MTTRLRTSSLLRLVLAAGLLGVIVWRVGAGPFIDGLRLVDARTLAIAFVIGAVTTLCCAWRWTVVSRALGLHVTLMQATAAYYRSIFLNTTLPGGVAGDVHRAVRHGRDAGDVGRGMRSVAWERSAGQLIQIVITIVVLLVVPSPVQAWMPAALALLAAATIAVVIVARRQAARGNGRLARGARTAIADVRLALLHPRAWPVVVTTSFVVVIGQAMVFIVAAQTAGTQASVTDLFPLALLVLAAMAIPLSIAGWGPREGVAAWAFAAAGLGAAAGVTTAVIYGVMVLVAGLPGALVLATSSRHHPLVAREEALHG